LFIGDVGRPDLAQKAVDDSKITSSYFIQNRRNKKKIMTPPDEVTVYPAHGAGGKKT
jgi:glyoxylase-like metal-dependent hydrolase (beta-lactamase superfamily II)